MSFGDLELHGHFDIFPWCKMKWSWDEFNNQSHILQHLETTLWSIVQTTLEHTHAKILVIAFERQMSQGDTYDEVVNHQCNVEYASE